ncbi:MAG: transglutaminase-like cysteine peptidase [Parvibaculum sp.]|uniref:transglutaminase-like cysteine peptidase n=1 Tax=Parvibaculum sp. TaxID=2024848 RepID=UPI00284562F1|nr:transglutaminase-like cysteine peptidase [Parvibaculum sp.]MDR3498333.1 transglutaminase-like cysteine peptidase [Parvibaculum sp.]
MRSARRRPQFRKIGWTIGTALPRRMFQLACMMALLAGCSSVQPGELRSLAAGSPADSFYLPAGQQVAPPYGFVSFCFRHESDCEGGTDKPANVALTPARWAELNEVNDFVNRMPQVSDQQRYGASGYWTYPDAQGGDCKDLALEKRRLLMARGWPAEALLLATAKRWDGEGHATLLVETDKGEFVLDNLNWEVVASRDVPYIWQARQSRERPYIWVNLDRDTFRHLDAKMPPLGAPIPFIEVARAAARAKQKTETSMLSGGLDELRLDPHPDVVADSRPPA